ncbi:hypothetical protein [Streptomyces abikoensis]|uniref:Uncharacterized protein n=1 Tax=Streptomyces abikoensis TaxID=97398 RepID=A0ABW7T9J4_9ACTN
MILQSCRRHPAAAPFLAECSGCKQELHNLRYGSPKPTPPDRVTEPTAVEVLAETADTIATHDNHNALANSAYIRFRISATARHFHGVVRLMDAHAQDTLIKAARAAAEKDTATAVAALGDVTGFTNREVVDRMYLAAGFTLDPS